MRVHLISFATLKYRHRQILLVASAKANGIVTTARSWTPAGLLTSEFPSMVTDISLSERGSGFWAWKPFVIREALKSASDGDIVFYCDVGRKFPYILLDMPLGGYLDWMNERRQSMMPGIRIPWNGTMAAWTKRDAFEGTGVDGPEIRAAAPVQASFSLWKAGNESRNFVDEWLSWCVQRRLVSDDPNPDGRPEASEFRGHRHDQSLLSLCCQKHGIQGLDIGFHHPGYNERDPGQVASHLWGTTRVSSAAGLAIRALAAPLQVGESSLRGCVSFGKRYD